MPLGKGMLMWDVVASARMDAKAIGLGRGWNKLAIEEKAEKITAVCVDLGLNWVSIKMTDGQYLFNRRKNALGVYVDDVLPVLVQHLKDANIAVWGWGFSYGGYWTKLTAAMKKQKGALVKANGKVCLPNGVNEGKAAASRVNQFNLAGWMIDAENVGGDAWMLGKQGKQHFWDYVKTMRTLIPSTTPIATCSYRMPDHQAYMPWATMLDLTEVAMPQVYWVGQHNPSLQLEKSWKQYMALKKQPYVPVGACYQDESTKWIPLPSDITEFFNKAVALGLSGCSYYALDEAGGVLEDPLLYDAIKSLTWPGITPTPEPEPEPEPVITKVTESEAVRTLFEGHPDMFTGKELE